MQHIVIKHGKKGNLNSETIDRFLSLFWDIQFFNEVHSLANSFNYEYKLRNVLVIIYLSWHVVLKLQRFQSNSYQKIERNNEKFVSATRFYRFEWNEKGWHDLNIKRSFIKIQNMCIELSIKATRIIGLVMTEMMIKRSSFLNVSWGVAICF